MWQDLMPRFAHCYRVIAPDTPGFGLSDPLPQSAPTIADLAQTLLAFAAALGLRRFAVFGMHTGGLIAAQMGLDAPERVAAVLVDGYACFNDTERAELDERYLPPFLPQWDGGHLAWLWARMREQRFYFPWYDGRVERSLTYPPPSTVHNHAAVMDILEVGDNYRAGYRAALAYGDATSVATLRVPTWLFYRDDDVLSGHRARLPPLAAPVQTEAIAGGKPALHARMQAVLATTLASEADLTPTAASPPTAQWQRRLLETSGGALCVYSAGKEGPLRLLLHALAAAPPRRTGAERQGRRLLAPDLPGHGGSDEWSGAFDVAAVALTLRATVQEYAPEAAVEVEAHGAACGLALALAPHLGTRLVALDLVAPWLLESAEVEYLLQTLPDPTPHRAGGHLLEAWQWTRDTHLFPPWLAPGAASRLRVGAPDPAAVHADAVEVIRLGMRLKPLLATALRRDWRKQLAALPCAVRVSKPHPLLAGRWPEAPREAG